MIRKRFVSALCTLPLCSAAFAQTTPPQAAATEQYCGKLAQIGASAWRTRSDGYPMDKVLKEVNNILGGKPDTLQDAHQVITTVYGDSSISSGKQAYTRVYDDCRQ